jgi:hypothetical protein
MDIVRINIVLLTRNNAFIEAKRIKCCRKLERFENNAAATS